MYYFLTRILIYQSFISHIFLLHAGKKICLFYFYFFILEHEPVADILSSSVNTVYGGIGDYGISVRSDVDVYKYMPLPELLKNSVTQPLLAQ